MKIYEELRERTREKGTQPPPKPSQKDPSVSPTKRQRNDFTKKEDSRLIHYLAHAAPSERGRHGDNVYKVLTQNVRLRLSLYATRANARGLHAARSISLE